MGFEPNSSQRTDKQPTTKQHSTKRSRKNYHTREQSTIQENNLHSIYNTIYSSSTRKLELKLLDIEHTENRGISVKIYQEKLIFNFQILYYRTHQVIYKETRVKTSRY